MFRYFILIPLEDATSTVPMVLRCTQLVAYGLMNSRRCNTAIRDTCGRSAIKCLWLDTCAATAQPELVDRKAMLRSRATTTPIS